MFRCAAAAATLPHRESRKCPCDELNPDECMHMYGLLNLGHQLFVRFPPLLLCVYALECNAAILFAFVQATTTQYVAGNETRVVCIKFFCVFERGEKLGRKGGRGGLRVGSHCCGCSYVR